MLTKSNPKPLRAGLVGLLLLLPLAPLPAAAESSPAAEGACSLLTREDLQQAGIVSESAPLHNSLSLEAEQTGAPTRIHADLCFAYHGPQGSRRTLGLTVERYEQIEGVAEWLERQNRKAAGDRTQVSQVGGITCERGDYPHESSASANAGLRQHYLSCDRLQGDKRIALTLETPDRASDLPADPVLAGLLETLIARIR